MINDNRKFPDPGYGNYIEMAMFLSLHIATGYLHKFKAREMRKTLEDAVDFLTKAQEGLTNPALGEGRYELSIGVEAVTRSWKQMECEKRLKESQSKFVFISYLQTIQQCRLELVSWENRPDNQLNFSDQTREKRIELRVFFGKLAEVDTEKQQEAYKRYVSDPFPDLGFKHLAT